MRRALMSVIVACISWSSAYAQQGVCELVLASGTLEVGEALDVQLICRNTGPPGAPEAVIPDGLDLRLKSSTPSRRSFTQIINGRKTSETSFTFAMRLTALKEGRYTLEPITVAAGGTSYQTDPVTVIVRKHVVDESPKGDRTVFAEIRVQPTSLYVTETFTAVLTIGIRKVEVGGRVYPIDLLRNVLDQRASQFSIFADGDVRRSERTLVDSRGVRHGYEVFTVTKRVRAEEVGAIGVGPVFLRANYPTKLRRGFWGGYDVRSSTAHTARASAVRVTVKGPPDEGRPESYTGAIGRYSFVVSAKPTRVEQGQPVTLIMIVRGAPLEGVAAPSLSANAELASRFDLTSDVPTGELERGAKVFRKAIFPKQVGEQTIPPITWSYFDLRRERYVTLTSAAVQLTVDPPSATTTAITLPVGVLGDDNTTSLTLLTGGISPNFVDARAVLADQTFTLTMPWTAALFGSPLMWLVVTLWVRHHDRLRSDVGLARRRRAKRNALSRLARGARDTSPGARLISAGAALTGYVADRFDRPEAALTATEVCRVLTDHQTDAATIDEVVLFLEGCDAVRYAPSAVAETSSDNVVRLVRAWIERIERSMR